MQTIKAFDKIRPLISQAYSAATEPSKVNIESFVGFVKVPVGLAGPLRVRDLHHTDDTFFAPLATLEATLVASCSRGCKAFNQCDGIQFAILGEGMSRAPIFSFNSPDEAVVFAKRVQGFKEQFALDAEKTSRYARLQHLAPHIIGSNVHVKFDYLCGDAVGQNMVTIATQRACNLFMESDAAKELGVLGVVIEGEMASDKKASWGNVQNPRGMQVMAWGELSNAVCEKVLRCRAERIHEVWLWMREGRFGMDNLGATSIQRTWSRPCSWRADRMPGAWRSLLGAISRCIMIRVPEI